MFPSDLELRDPWPGVRRRHRVREKTLGRAIKRAVRQVQISKLITTRTLRHLFPTHLVERGQGIRAIRELRGHSHGDTKMIYAHVLNGGTCVISLGDDALALALQAENG